MKPETWQSSFTSLGSAQGLGGYYAGTNSTGGAGLRGGSWSTGSYAGVLSLLLYNPAGASAAFIGFRCVYRP